MTDRPEHAPADAETLEKLEQVLGPGGVREVEPRYLEEPRGRHHGRAGAVLRPSNAENLAKAVKICSDARVAMVARSGGTGLVGGQVMETGPEPVLISFERMNTIREVDPRDNIIVAEAGVVLSDVHDAATDVDRLFPLALASQGTACIGGLLATNAGGVNVLRYGNARDLCLGIECVMADGTVHHGLGGLVKDNMGYDLRHLMIGSEGTLGLITAAVLRLHPVPRETVTGWIAVGSPDEALELLNLMRGSLGGSISAFELIHRQGLDFLREKMPDVPIPPDFDSEWLVLTEAADGQGAMVEERFMATLEAAFEEGAASDGLIAQSGTQREAFWNVRESIPEANRLVGAVASHDVSLKASRIAEFIGKARSLLEDLNPDLRLNCFGHLGDGNLHFNIYGPKGANRKDYDRYREPATQLVHETVHEFGGSVSAEHGVGRLKVADLERYGDPAKLKAMRALKQALDPLGILNPGAVLA
ncbi:FAD-binding oxidoreductase [Amaricoccus tamworthensis]|uniref:FAD-binding oxidoreductase n=1 Tax=Amaricoccus tamworthensis TaxID=57002 RepID=UPI003C7D7D28